MKERIAELEEALRKVRRTHLECEDCWYSCPKSAEGCCNDSVTGCSCGADWANEIIDRALGSENPDFCLFRADPIGDPLVCVNCGGLPGIGRHADRTSDDR